MLVRKIRKVLVIFKLMNSQAIHDGCHDGKKLRNADLSAHSWFSTNIIVIFGLRGTFLNQRILAQALFGVEACSSLWLLLLLSRLCLHECLMFGKSEPHALCHFDVPSCQQKPRQNPNLRQMRLSSTRFLASRVTYKHIVRRISSRWYPKPCCERNWHIHQSIERPSYCTFYEEKQTKWNRSNQGKVIVSVVPNPTATLVPWCLDGTDHVRQRVFELQLLDFLHEHLLLMRWQVLNSLHRDWFNGKGGGWWMSMLWYGWRRWTSQKLIGAPAAVVVLMKKQMRILRVFFF